jgi:hypothetical protein
MAAPSGPPPLGLTFASFQNLGPSLVDDGGTTVVYVQLSGEAFGRREVRVAGRSGNEVSVEGLRAGERLVTRGGAAIRRASLLSTGAPEGHVH